MDTDKNTREERNKQIFKDYKSFVHDRVLTAASKGEKVSLGAGKSRFGTSLLSWRQNLSKRKFMSDEFLREVEDFDKTYKAQAKSALYQARRTLRIERKFEAISAKYRDVGDIPKSFDEYVSAYTRYPVAMYEDFIKKFGVVDVSAPLNQLHFISAVTLEPLSNTFDWFDSRYRLSDFLTRVDKALNMLKSREQMIIRMKYGFPPYCRTFTLREIADECGVSATSIGQIESRAIRRLRNPSRRGFLIPCTASK